ncbi:transcription factor LHW-like [Impatiens glandulifera]|uniref:transcription factor LHW-like n=1 Tax=Impatiens glandulifera TaxID=253017 RepID=UPI001FB12A5E|nr:transcription factor LHW-like [Impatiens glandulifera]
MGYLLKEALKTLCGVNQWSYAIFWKIGLQNPKLLIWEECYYDHPIQFSGLPGISAIDGSELALEEWEACWNSSGSNHNPMFGVQTEDKVHLLVNKMMMDNQIKIVGEGLVGRAAFTGQHLWIQLENFTKEAYPPPEVLSEVNRQSAAGIKTVAVIPIPTYGVVQLASPLNIAENMGFVNDVKSLIHQLGCISSNLLSDSSFFHDIGDCINNSFGTHKLESSIPYVADGGSISSVVRGTFDHSSDSLTRQIQGNHGSRADVILPSNPEIWSNNSTSGLLPNDYGNSYGCLSTINDQLLVGSSSVGNRAVSDARKHEFAKGFRGKTNEMALEKEREESLLFHEHNFNMAHYEEGQASMNNQIPALSSGDGLLEVLVSDFKKKTLKDEQRSACNGIGATNEDFHCSFDGGNSASGIFSINSSDNLLDAVVGNVWTAGKQLSEDSLSCKTSSLAKLSGSSVPGSDNVQGEMFGLPKSLEKLAGVGSCSFKSECTKEEVGNCSQSSSMFGSQISSLIGQSQSLKQTSNSASTGYSKRPDEACKTNRKRLKPGENPRPRPKDRQMIQDRMKELRDIVPNGAKCSIDALLERTIKHMLFLQSVTKHADKLKQSGESKIISKDGELLLKDNFGGGRTWAYEVGSQSMVCPIIVEDLNAPRQMLVEMLCEERGLFLEIADIIRGLGLTILKGVMETRNDKIWARFAVEANRDVTRMEIFLSLVHLLEQTTNKKRSSSSSSPTNNNYCLENESSLMLHHHHHQAPVSATGNSSSSRPM